MKGNTIIIGLVCVLFLSGCAALFKSGPEKQYLCSDDLTVVSDLSDCPKVDMELKECQEASSDDYYGVSDRDVCYYELALDRENATLCRKIRNNDEWYDYTAAKCGAEIALFKGDVNVCDELSFLAKYDCYLELATQMEDPDVCAEITSSNKRDDCYSDLASELYDPYICSEIRSESKMDDCIYNYISWNSYYIDDWGICDMFSSSVGWEQSYCYEEAAKETGDLSYCNKITSPGSFYDYYSKPICYAAVAKAKYNPSLCEKLTGTEDKDECYYEYAVTYPYDPDACENIKDGNQRESCLYTANYSYSYYY